MSIISSDDSVFSTRLHPHITQTGENQDLANREFGNARDDIDASIELMPVQNEMELSSIQSELELSSLKCHLDIVTSRGTRTDLLSSSYLTDQDRRDYRRAINELSQGVDNFTLDITHLLSRNRDTNSHQSHLSSDKNIQTIRRIVEKAGNVRAKVWNTYLDGMPSHTNGPKIFARKGERLDKLTYEESDLHKDLDAKPAAEKDQGLKRYVASREAVDSMREKLKKRKKEIEDNGSIHAFDKNRRIRTLQAAIEKLQTREEAQQKRQEDWLTEAAILFEATHPVPNLDPAAPDYDKKLKEALQKKQKESLEFVQRKPEPRSEKQPANTLLNMNPFFTFKSDVSIYTEEQRLFANEMAIAGTAGTSPVTWRSGELHLDSPEKAVGVEVFFMQMASLAASDATNQQIEAGTHSAMSNLLLGDLDVEDSDWIRTEYTNEIFAVRNALRDTTVPATTAANADSKTVADAFKNAYVANRNPAPVPGPNPAPAPPPPGNNFQGTIAQPPLPT